jgi:hypothetical protein
LVLCAFALTACISGSARDQHEQATRAATKEGQLENIQSTTVAERFKREQASPAPTITVQPGISNLVLARGVSQSGQPQNSVESVSRSDGTVYAAAQMSGLQPGQTVIAVWSTVDGASVGQSEHQVTSPATEQWVSFAWQPGGVAAGMYAVTIYIDAVDIFHEITSLAFRVY